MIVSFKDCSLDQLIAQHALSFPPYINRVPRFSSHMAARSQGVHAM